MRAILRTILSRNGYNILEAQNRRRSLPDQRAVHDRNESPPQDRCRHAQDGGKQLAKRLALQRPQMRTLYISGYADSSIANHNVFDSKIAFLPKPITPDVLLRKVRDVLDAGR